MRPRCVSSRYAHAVRILNRTSLPLRLAACGFPFFRRLPPYGDSRAGLADGGQLDLLRWQSDGAAGDDAYYDENGLRRAAALTSITLCVDDVHEQRAEEMINSGEAGEKTLCQRPWNGCGAARLT